ncbi:11676_t:CDS:2, partial [Acaulospora morrowiae]
IVNNTQNVSSTEDISSENFEQNPRDDSSKQIDSRFDENLTYNIVDNASNSDEPNSRRLAHANASASGITDNTLNPNDTHEESNTSNLDTYQESVSPTSPIHTESKSLEEKEEDEIMDSMYKERTSKEIIQKIKEKRLRDQDLSI